MFETLLTPERIAPETAADYRRDRTITDFLEDRAAEMPDNVAFLDSGRQVTVTELKHLVDRAAPDLLERGVGPGDVVSFQLRNGIEWVVVHPVASRTGAISNRYWPEPLLVLDDLPRTPSGRTQKVQLRAQVSG